MKLSRKLSQNTLSKILTAALCLLIFLTLAPTARAAEMEAETLDGPGCVAAQAGFRNVRELFDGNENRPQNLAAGGSLTLERAEGLGSLYLIFDGDYAPVSVKDNASGREITFGEENFLHCFLDLAAAFGTAPASVTLTFAPGTPVNELYLFGPGEAPGWVQRWEEPREGEMDILLFSTHGDDEQLFFAGLLPTYAGERGLAVQVVYLTDHHNTAPLRRHEMLNGLWAVGVRGYPVFGPFGDYFCQGSKDKAYACHAYRGETEEELLGFVVEQLRKYRPLVAVGHDPLRGEYGHGQHMMYADLLCRGLEAAADGECYPELAARYGLWDVPKTYLHLWPEGQITLDWDVPLERFGGMTAFQVSKDLGFACHKSQLSDFAWYYSGCEKAADVKRFSPCAFGLYRSTVGPDGGAGDLLENLAEYARGR